MGREATCTCTWAGTGAQVKALIEPPDLILRGGIRKRLPLAELKHVHAEGDHLRFEFAGESISIALGNAIAAKWAQAMTAPPVTLAKKLGISAETSVRMLGVIDDDALRDALDVARQVSKNTGNLIIARVATSADILDALQSAAPELAAGKPIWFVYPKGKGHALSESDLRTLGLAAGLVDTKVAAVSPRLAALRFVRRNAPRPADPITRRTRPAAPVKS